MIRNSLSYSYSDNKIAVHEALTDSIRTSEKLRTIPNLEGVFSEIQEKLWEEMRNAEE